MTPEEIAARIAEIEAMDDDENQHMEEDNLYVDVLFAIAQSKGKMNLAQVREIAKAALEARHLSFSRWYA